MTTAEYVIDVLGGANVFKGRGVPTATELRERVRAGFPYQSLESVRERLNLTLPEVAVVLHVPLRTLARRRRGRTLAAGESDRVPPGTHRGASGGGVGHGREGGGVVQTTQSSMSWEGLSREGLTLPRLESRRAPRAEPAHDPLVRHRAPACLALLPASVEFSDVIILDRDGVALQRRTLRDEFRHRDAEFRRACLQEVRSPLIDLDVDVRAHSTRIAQPA